MSKRAKLLFLTFSALLLLSTALITGYLFGLSLKKEPEPEIPLEKATHTIYPCWPAEYLDTAPKDAATIVYGTVGAPGITQVHVGITSDGSWHSEYHCLTKIQVIQMLKGDPDAKTVTYLNPEGETDTIIYGIYGGSKVIEGQSYLFFLNKHGCYLNPATVIQVSEDGTLIPPWGMAFDSSETRLFPEDTPIPVEDYLAIVQQYLDESR